MSLMVSSKVSSGYPAQLLADFTEDAMLDRIPSVCPAVLPNFVPQGESNPATKRGRAYFTSDSPRDSGRWRPGCGWGCTGRAGGCSARPACNRHRLSSGRLANSASREPAELPRSALRIARAVEELAVDRLSGEASMASELAQGVLAGHCETARRVRWRRSRHRDFAPALRQWRAMFRAGRSWRRRATTGRRHRRRRTPLESRGRRDGSG